jgi:hypothetical protein
MELPLTGTLGSHNSAAGPLLYYEMERILDHQDVQVPGRTRGKITGKYLICWKGYPPSGFFGEMASNLRDCDELLQWQSVRDKQ